MDIIHACYFHSQHISGTGARRRWPYGSLMRSPCSSVLLWWKVKWSWCPLVFLWKQLAAGRGGCLNIWFLTSDLGACFQSSQRAQEWYGHVAITWQFAESLTFGFGLIMWLWLVVLKYSKYQPSRFGGAQFRSVALGDVDRKPARYIRSAQQLRLPKRRLPPAAISQFQSSLRWAKAAKNRITPEIPGLKSFMFIKIPIAIAFLGVYRSTRSTLYVGQTQVALPSRLSISWGT